MPLLVGLPQTWGDDHGARHRWNAAKAAWRSDAGLTGAAGWQALPASGWWLTVAASAPTEAEAVARVDARLAGLGLHRRDLPRLAAEARAGWPRLFAPVSASPWGTPLQD